MKRKRSEHRLAVALADGMQLPLSSSEHRLAVALAARRPAIATIDEDAVRRHLQANATCFEPNRDTSPGMRVLTTAPLDPT